MSVNQEFYITLPSNVDNYSEFETNKVSNYKTKLNKKFVFPRDEIWKVGLCEISYTKSWFNVREPIQFKFFDSTGLFCYENADIDETKKSEEIKNFIFDSVHNTYLTAVKSPKLKKGYYESIVQLKEEINKRLGVSKATFEKAPQLFWDNFNQRIKIIPGVCNGKFIYPYLGDELENIFGLKDYNGVSLYEKCWANEYSKVLDEVNIELDKSITRLFKEDGYYLAPKSAELDAGCNNLYVYCDIIEHNCVGNAYSQLLRTVEVPNEAKYGQTISRIYDTPHFISLISNSFDNIHIIIKDDTGQDIPFECGRVKVKLLFKKYD